MFKKLALFVLLAGILALGQNSVQGKWIGKEKMVENKVENVKKEAENLPYAFVPMNNAGENRVWVGTFQLVWNVLEDDIIKAPIKFEGVNSKLADDLNKRSFEKDMLRENSYYIKSGNTTPALKKEIENGIYEKFGEKSDILDSINFDNDENILIYAMLKKNFQFINELDKINGSKFMDKPVKFFGIEEDAKQELRRSVKVLFYNNENDFAIKLYTTSKDNVILYRTDENDSFEKYFNDVNTKTVNDYYVNNFSSGDSLKIPYIKFDNIFQYDELTGHKIENTNYYINDAIQTVKFKMDNKGVELKSEAAISVALTAVLKETSPSRQMNFDKPFVLFLIEEGKTMPYFIAHFKNADLFEKTEE